MVQSGVTVDVVAAPFDTIDTDLLVLPVFEMESVPGEHPLVAATGGEVARALASGEFKGKPFELFFSPIVESRWKARRVLVGGLGRRADYSVDRLRRLATAAALAARQRRHERVAVIWADAEHLAQDLQRGARLL